MANVIITVKIMPKNPDIDLKNIEFNSKNIISKFTDNKETKTEIEPIGFGLKALRIIFVMDENKGSPDPVSEEITRLEGVNSAEIVDVRRALG